MGGGQSKKDNKCNRPTYSTQMPLIPVQLQQQQPQQPFQQQPYGQFNSPYGQMMPLPQPIMNTLQPLDMNSLSSGNLAWQQTFQPPTQQPMYFQPPMTSTQMSQQPYEQSMTAPQVSVPKMTCEREMNSTMSTVWLPPQQQLNPQPPIQSVPCQPPMQSVPCNSNVCPMPSMPIPPMPCPMPPMSMPPMPTQGRVRVYNYGPVPRTN